MKNIVRLFIGIAIYLICLKGGNCTVLGIDFGTEFIKSSLISPGKSFMIIEDMTSKRKTPSSVFIILCFYQQKRFYEYECATKRHRSPQSTFLSLRKYLTYSGKQAEALQEYTETNYEFLNTTYNEQSQRFELWFTPNLPHALTFPQITSMVLKHLKSNVQRMTEIKVKDIVMTVPYVSDPMTNLYLRQSLLEAAELAGLNLLGFIHENIAANLYFAVERLDDVPVNVMLINIGSGSMQVSISQMVKVNSTAKKEIQTLRVLGQVTEERVSGYILDQIIAKILASKFDEKRKGKKSVTENKATMIKLHKESAKIKEVLSANKEMNVYVENLADGEDFHALITRAEFEDVLNNLQPLIVNALDQCLEKANLTLNEIKEVELIGGVVRVPRIQQILGEFIGKVDNLEAGQHLNGDEAMALGSAFYAANMSHSFRVRPIWMSDGFDFDIKLQITNLDPLLDEEFFYNKSTMIFPKNTKFGTRKVITFRYAENIKCEFFAIDHNGSLHEFQEFHFTNISAIKEDSKYEKLGKPKLNLQFILNSIDPIELEVGEASLVEEVEVKETKKKQKKEKKEKKEKKKEDDDEEEEEDEILKAKMQEEQGEKNESEPVEETNVSNEEVMIKLKNVTHYIELKSKEKLLTYRRLNQSEFRRAKSEIKQLDEAEEMLQKNAKAKNELESLIYEIQAYNEDETFITHSKEEDRSKIFELASINDEWLYSQEAFTSNYTEFSKRHLEMKRPYYNVLNRIEHTKQRPEVIETSQQKLLNQQKKAENLNKTMPWVDSEEIESLFLLISEAKEWLDGQIEKQNQSPLHDDPIFTQGDVQYRLKDIDDEIARIKKIKKPKKEKDKKSQANNSTENNETNNETLEDLEELILEENKNQETPQQEKNEKEDETPQQDQQENENENEAPQEEKNDNEDATQQEKNENKDEATQQDQQENENENEAPQEEKNDNEETQKKNKNEEKSKQKKQKKKKIDRDEL